MNPANQVLDFTTIRIKRLNNEIKQDFIINANFTDLEIYLINTENNDEYHTIFKYKNINVKCIFSTEYPFRSPQIFINNLRNNINIKWSPVIRIFIKLSEIIDSLIDKYTNKPIFVPELGGFFNDGTNRSFSSGDLHHSGHLYNCHNFDSNKYQFGSGFIYSILKKYFNEYHFSFPIDMINTMVDNLIDYPLIKEIGCVYLVLKIYEEQIISPIQSYFDVINQYLITQNLKLRFNNMKNDFKRDNSIIIENLVERLDSLNHILTIYINIWLYHNFPLENNGIALHNISFNLNGIIDSFIHQQSNTDLYSWSMQFIQIDRPIVQFNGELFLNNYHYVLINLRNNSPVLIKFIKELLVLIKAFNNFTEDMLSKTEKMNYFSEAHRLSQYKQIYPTETTFPRSLIVMENTETTICTNLQRILGHNVSLLLPGSFCEQIEN